MAARDELRWEENLVAAIAGLGLLLAILGGLLIGFDADNGDTAGLFAIAGIGLVVVATIVWFVLVRPDKQFDDLQTPYFTGHHHEEEHLEEAEIDVAAEMVVEEGVMPPITEPVAETVVADSTVEEEAIEPPEAPEVEEESPAEEPEADDLRHIEGIGPKAAEALYSSGITTYAEIAKMSPEDLERIVKDEKGVRIVGSTSTWVRQAVLAAADEDAQLEELKARIKNGVLYDDLMQIEGIDSTIQEALNEARIRSYDELAAASLEELEKALADADISGADPVKWPIQAQAILDRIYNR